MSYQPILLGVNIDHVATIRQQRGTTYPEPVEAALIAESHGADGITVHLREDRRHIQDRDVRLLNEVIQTRLNLEMAASEEMLTIARQVKPAFCCLVPEKREELTTEGGLDVKGQYGRIQDAVHALMEHGTKVSLFIEADETQISAAKETGAEYIEIHTGHYADAVSEQERENHLAKIITQAKFAHSLGLKVNAGHGLTLQNVGPIAAIKEFVELNIGHAIVARAVMVGLGQAVQEMKTAMVKFRELAV